MLNLEVKSRMMDEFETIQERLAEIVVNEYEENGWVIHSNTSQMNAMWSDIWFEVDALVTIDLDEIEYQQFFGELLDSFISKIEEDCIEQNINKLNDQEI